MSQGIRRLAAIMFTDMVSYTALGQRNEGLSIALADEQRKLIRPILDRHGGREVKTMGDGFLVEFSSALEAVRCAYDIQRATREFNFSLPEDRRIHLRVGVHLGDVVESNGELSGDAINVASRIEAFAEDGNVCLTRQVYDQVLNKFELPMQGIGQKSLKNVAIPMELFKVMMPWSDSKTAQALQLDRTRTAILPFANMSPDPQDDYFADGMTEEIISTTSSITGLTLIARTSVMRYKETTKGIEDIGRELGVGTVLEGSVRKAGNRLRITVQLIDVQTQGHLWAQSYDRDFGDVFAVQSDIARRVADALRARILPGESTRIEKKPTTSTEAYELYLRGRQHWNKRSHDDLFKAIEYFENAVRIDPEYALAYSGLADSYNVLADDGYLPNEDAYSKARENAQKAVQLDDSLAEAHTSLADTLAAEYDWKGSEREFKRAIELKPNYGVCHYLYGILLMRTGRFEEALREALLAQQHDPLSPHTRVLCGQVYGRMGNYALAEEHLKKLLLRVPYFSPFFSLYFDSNFVPGIVSLARVYLQEGKYDDAENEINEFLRITNDKVLASSYQAVVQAFRGNQSKAREIIERIGKARYSRVANQPLVLAHLRLGDEERAIELIQQEFESKAKWIPELNFEAIFQGVRSEPRVVAILEKIGFTQ